MPPKKTLCTVQNKTFLFNFEGPKACHNEPEASIMFIPECNSYSSEHLHNWVACRQLDQLFRSTTTAGI